MALLDGKFAISFLSFMGRGSLGWVAWGGGRGGGGGGGMVPTPTFAGSFIVPQTPVSHNFSVFPNVAFIGG